MTIYDYIASSNPHDANVLLSNYGFENSDDLLTISDRLRAIVRKYKRTALHDISSIHPDKDLISLFAPKQAEEFNYSYATGRTPDFLEPPLEEEGFVQAPPPPPPIEPTPAPLDQSVIEEIQKLQKEVKKDKASRMSAMRKKSQLAQLNQTGLLMCAVAFAIGYMLGKNN